MHVCMYVCMNVRRSSFTYYILVTNAYTDIHKKNVFDNNMEYKIMMCL